VFRRSRFVFCFSEELYPQILLKDSLFEDLILNAHILFDEHPSQYPNSPPLPPTPAGEVALEISYGSKTTKVASVPAKPQSPLPGSSQDFSPKLPPRPVQSIHPSSRGTPMSSTRPQAEIPSQTMIVTQSSVSAPSSPSPVSTASETDDSLSYHDPELTGETESQRRPSTSTGAAAAAPLSPPSLRKTKLPPTPKETPASSPLESQTFRDN
jgi:hypothetical protein